MKKLLYLSLALLFVSSCALLGLNIKRKTPRRAEKLPEFSSKDSLVGYLSKDRACYHPYYYELDISFDPVAKKIAGNTQIFLEAKEDFKEILLNLNEEMAISAITWEGQTLTYRRKHTGLWIVFPQNIAKGNKLKLEVQYAGIPVVAKRPPWEGGLVWKKDTKKRDWIGVACEQVGANLWWPLKDHLTAEPDSMKMTYRVPQGLTCVSNGKLVEKKDTNNQSSFTYFVSYPINTYNVTFYIGHFEHFSQSYNKEEKKRLHYYVLDYNLEVAKKHFIQTKKIISTFEKIYGEYPFWRDEYKLVESPFEGMEHQTAIAYGHGYENNNYGVDYIILHESAHEWWGNAISVKDYADIWIHEGMATYSEALYIEEQFGYSSYLDYLGFYSMLIKNKKPMVGPRDVNFWNYKDSDPYMKGALMMHSLRSTLNNDSLFFGIIKSFYQTYKYQTVTSADFIAMVNNKTGKNYDWFFQQYLYSRYAPCLEYQIILNEKTGEQKLYYRWTNVAENFVMPIYIRYPDGTKTRIYPEIKVKSLTIWGQGKTKVGIDLSSGYFAKKEKKLK